MTTHLNDPANYGKRYSMNSSEVQVPLNPKHPAYLEGYAASRAGGRPAFWLDGVCYFERTPGGHDSIRWGSERLDKARNYIDGYNAAESESV
jgi:hypothetical protein